MKVRLAALGLLAGISLAAFAQDAALVDRAKKEGTVTVYTSLAPTESQPMAEAFERKYGIKVELWRSQSERVVQRVVSEAKAGRNTVDVVATNGPEMEALAREKVLTTYFTPHAADLPAASIPRHRLWMPDRLQDRKSVV